MNPKVDDYLLRISAWQAELTLLRNILLECGLTEELKWGVPCYVFESSNIILLQNFKAYCAIGFLKGALLQDTKGLLKKLGEHTQGGRVFPFLNTKEIVKQKALIKSYIFEAIELEKAGLKIEVSATTIEVPEELEQQFKKTPAFKKAFYQLTPGKQRAYLIHFTGAKQSATRTSRIEKYTPQILCGKGFYDCTCGLSKKMPICDGSHKFAR
jgi:uncharacterized protein YdeI (YjbR/CyaY-like superfamily)